MAGAQFDPEAVRAFEQAGWERAAAAYPTTFAGATRPFIQPLLDAARVGCGTDWVLTSMTPTVPGLAAVTVSANFSGGRISGHSGCNT